MNMTDNELKMKYLTNGLIVKPYSFWLRRHGQNGLNYQIAMGNLREVHK